MRQLVSILFICFSMTASADEVLASYKEVDLIQFYKQNHVSETMALKQQRAMVRPSLVRFKAELVSRPKSGEFTLAYDALRLWGAAKELPIVDHSAFIGFPNSGPVLGAYVTQKAAEMLSQIDMDKPVTFYAMHIYNYSRGPRLVILAAESAPAG